MRHPETRLMAADTPTSEHTVPPLAPAPPAGPRWRRSRLSLVGLVVSVVSLGAVIWWASRQQAPELPHTPGELLALVGAIAGYGLATVVRSERWQRLLTDESARPARADAYALNCVGYMGNNTLPARAGDAIRVLLMAPRAATSKRTVLGTLVAERLLDVALLVVLFVVVGWGLLGKIGGGKVEIIAAVAAVGALVAVVGWRVVQRNERLHEAVAPIASATLRLRRAHHGLRLLAFTVVIWTIEAATWMMVGAAVGFGMDPIEAVYLVALASVFSMIPSGPAYAGTQDAAVAIGIKALGGTGATAVAYLLMLRFVIVVPITLVGFGLLVTRYGGLARLRGLRSAARE
jgi:glycosyltransferase 2 family protein